MIESGRIAELSNMRRRPVRRRVRRGRVDVRDRFHPFIPRGTAIPGAMQGMGFSLKPPKKVRKVLSAIKRNVTLKRALIAGGAVLAAPFVLPVAAAAGGALLHAGAVAGGALLRGGSAAGRFVGKEVGGLLHIGKGGVTTAPTRDYDPGVSTDDATPGPPPFVGSNPGGPPPTATPTSSQSSPNLPTGYGDGSGGGGGGGASSGDTGDDSSGGTSTPAQAGAGGGGNLVLWGLGAAAIIGIAMATKRPRRVA